MTPDFSRGFLRIPLPVWLSVYCRGALTRRQIQLVSVVIRESWGWRAGDGSVHTWTKPLKSRQFADSTGLAIDHIRRDLQLLLDRGVLRERAGRYQFIGSPALWITTSTRAQKVRGLPQEWSNDNAETAFSNLASKRDQRKKRNVTGFSESDLSPGGEKPSSRSSFVRPGRNGDQQATRALAHRLADVVATFAGPLSPKEVEALLRWIDESGVAAVWSALEPAFRLGSIAGRQHLQAVLSERMGELPS